MRFYSLLASLLATAAFSIPHAALATALDVARPETVKRQLPTQNIRPSVGGAPLITTSSEGSKPLKGDVTFVLKSVKFEGADQFSADELSSIYSDKISKKITLSELNKIVDQTTALYRNNGYILTRAVLPPQQINGGNVKIRIIEGYVNSVRVEGEQVSHRIQRYVDKIKESRPLNAKDLERYLLLINDLPGVSARAVLQPSPSTPGASDVVVNISRKNVNAALSVDNRGTRYLGPVQASATVEGHNLLGMDDSTSLRVLNTPFYFDELKYGEIRHEQRIGNEGTQLILAANMVETRPDYTLETLDIVGKNLEFSAAVSHPLLRSRQSNWFVNSDFSVQRINVNSVGSNLYQDHLRVLSLGTAYDFVDRFSAVNRMEVSGHQGFNWYTSNDGAAHSRTNGKAAFTKVDTKLSRLQPISGPFSAYVAVSGQYSAQPLLAAEEFAIGGSEFGSAYDPAEISGDAGVATRAELQFNQTRESKYLPNYQLYGYYDIGKVWNRDIVGASEVKTASLSSTGIGTRFNLLDPLSGGMEVAIPLTRKVAANGADGYSPRFFFNLQYRY